MSGCFYFISDRFYDEFPEKGLMKNRDGIPGKSGGRPCFFAFPDLENPELLWLIPISSKVEKYKAIHQKILRQRKTCNTLHFCEFLHEERVFLIQNIFPVTKDYISDIYVDSMNKEIKIDYDDEKRIIHKARQTLRLHSRGIRVLFVDVDHIKDKLLTKNKI